MAKLFRQWIACKNKYQRFGYGWFQLWIGLGITLSILLLVTSISTYMLVSRRAIVEQLRNDLASQVGFLDQQVKRGEIRNLTQLAAVLQHLQDGSNRRIAWIQIQNGEGSVVSQAGSFTTVAFTNQEIRSGFAHRQPVFKTVKTENGVLLVEEFPFHLPLTTTQAMFSLVHQPDRMPRSFGRIAIGAFLEKNSAPWPLRRNLIINSSAALVLLLSVIVLAARLRSYVVGRQLEQEVEIARNVQKDLLPSPGYKPESFELAADCIPAARVSGDFFDTFSGRDNQPTFVLGDVSGKGVPAALLMGVIHGAVRSSSWTESAAHHIKATQQLNQLLHERAASERFATMFWSYFDSASQHLKYINAGHCPPLLWKANYQNTILHLNAGGPVLGLLPQAEFQQGSVRLNPGDILVLYSDGVVEAANQNEEEFGEQRLQEILTENSARNAEEIRNQILASVEAFTGKVVPEDDRTLCVIVYSGPAKASTHHERNNDRKVMVHAA